MLNILIEYHIFYLLNVEFYKATLVILLTQEMRIDQFRDCPGYSVTLRPA